jgi:putative transposase
MPRRARVTVAGLPHHVIQCGNNRQSKFFAEDDYHWYLAYLREPARKNDRSIQCAQVS